MAKQMTGTKEFYELMDVFERQKNLFHGRMDRENLKEVPAGVFYQDGAVNQMFKAFMAGYQYHKSISNQE